MILAIIYILIYYLNVTECSECYSTNPTNTYHLGSKTPYRLVANFNDSIINYPGCRPIKMLGILRHGTRTPSDNVLEIMKTKLTLLKQHVINNTQFVNLCDKELRKIQEWKMLYQAEEEGEKILTHEGEDEMLELAERLQNRFPTLLPETYSNDTYHFRFTETERTEKSAKYFTIGLFGKKFSNYVWYSPALKKDPILRFYKLCNRWRREVKNNDSAFIELNKYKISENVNNACLRISERLGLNYSLTFDDVHLIYMTCSFETAWKRNKISPWCSVFTKKDIEIIEYAEDLRFYLKDGYGYPINYKQACKTARHIYEILINNKDNQLSRFYFTHSGTMLKLIAHLNLYKDKEPLRHDRNIEDIRKWRVSKIDSFASNLIFVVFRCETGDKLLLLHQEKIVKLPGCPENEDLCSLSHLEDTFSDKADTCDFKKICA